MMVFGIPYWVWLADIAMAFFAGKVAQDRGYSFRAYFILSLFLPVIGLIVALTRPEGDGTATSTETDKAKALREYKALLDDETITKSEFDAKKRELLG